MLYEDMFTVSFLAFDSVQALDVCGPTEVFATANELSGTEHYRTRVLSPDGQVFRATNGLRRVADGVAPALSQSRGSSTLPPTARSTDSVADEHAT